MGPQSNAMSVGNAETISNPPLPSSFQPPPPSSDLTPDLKRLQRADVSGAMSPPQIQNKPAQDGRIWTLRPDSFPDVRIPEESQIELPANAFDSAHTMPRYDPVTYSKGHSIVARPMIEHAIRQGQDVPTEAMLNNAFEAANLLPPKYGTRLNSANDFVSRSREAGRDNTKTADDLKWLMEMKAEDRKTIGYGPLPSIALPAAALSEADGEHHSGYQPRAKDGTFKGPPSEEWYGRGE